MTSLDEAMLRQRVLERLEGSIPTAKYGRRIERFRGCLIGGAIGDALGASVEFMSRAQILDTFGARGITDYAPAYGRVGAITDDTQMTLFTGEGLLRAFVRAQLRGIGPAYASVTDSAYARWLMTQGEAPGFGPKSIDEEGGWLTTRSALFSRRAPGLTCLSSLREKDRAGIPARNDSKGCGGVMRIAPVGLFRAAMAGEPAGYYDEQTFQLGCELAALTHGHVTGQLPAGYLAVLIAGLAAAGTWADATSRAWQQLSQAAHHEETSRLIDRALLGAATNPGSWEYLTSLGEGWVAEEALAMSLYCAAGAICCEKENEVAVREALLLAVNHGGDSDSTGSITGNILGAIFEESALPSNWQATLELNTTIGELAEDLATYPIWDIGTLNASPESLYWQQRYPGA